MNHSYRLVWNDSTQRYVPAPETARGHGKSRTAKALAPMALLLGALLATSAGAQALPTGEKVVSGEASIGRSGAQMTITQTSEKAVLQWQHFNIGSDATVRFDQPNASAIALNRVLGGSASQIDGQLRANGQVWLVNPNGVVFGQDSQVNVGGLIASTLGISDEDFSAGRQVFTRGAAQGGITNQGQITVVGGGTLALLASTVKNEGTLRARMGNVVLAGGDQVTLQAGAEGRLQVKVDPATVRTLIENERMIIADGGQVVMTSRAADALSASVVSNSGTVQARTLGQKEGRILLLADMRHGEVVQSVRPDAGVPPRLDASAPEGGHGGFVETSAAVVRIANEVTTKATEGKTGNWLISSPELTISEGTNSGIGADTLAANLANTSVTLQTVADGTEKRDIHVNAPIRWSENTLTLNAHGSINVNAVMEASGTAGLEMNYGGYSADTPAAAEGSGVHMALSGSGFTGRVDFTGKDADASTNQLKINGDSYTILTELGNQGSNTGLDLQGIDGNLSGKYALGADIVDAGKTADWNEGAGFAPIGGHEAPFTGIFDGLGHTIKGLIINRTEGSYTGLFSHAQHSILRNVGLVGGGVIGPGSVGVLAGYAEGASISEAYATGIVRGGWSWRLGRAVARRPTEARYNG